MLIGSTGVALLLPGKRTGGALLTRVGGAAMWAGGSVASVAVVVRTEARRSNTR